MRRVRGLLAFAVVASALIPPAAASAERWVTYRVTVEGDGVYRNDRDTPDTDARYRAHFTWRTVLPVLTFQGDKPLTGSPDNARPETTGTLLSGDSVVTTASDTYQCTPVGVEWVNPGRFLEDDGIPTPEPTIGLRMLHGLGLDWNWCDASALAGFSLAGVLENDLHTYDTWFTVPRETIGMGRIINLVHEEATGRRCPNNADGVGDCTLTLDATITLDKTNDFELADGPPPEVTEDDIPTPDGPAPIDADAVVVRPTGNGLPASGRKAAVTVNCPSDCAGTVTATLPAKRGASASASKSKVLARKRFTARRGEAKRVVLRFSRRARNQVLRAGGVTLRVRTSAGGRTDTQRVDLRLGAGKPSQGGRGPRPLSSGD